VKSLLTLLLTCFGIGAVPAQAKPVELYRFQNDDGVTVLAQSIPSDLVHKGYEVVSEDGTVLRVVARELTPEERKERDRKLEEEKAAKDAGAARARHDLELTKLYASARDVEEARDRKLLSIDTAAATTKANLESLKLKKRHLEEQAADREREGLAPSADILDNLKILETQIEEKNRELEKRKVERQQVNEQFNLDLERIKLLYGIGPVKAAQATPPAR